MKTYQIVKADGDLEEFNSEKLRRSLSRSGAEENVVENVVKHVESVLHDGMLTEDIYNYAFSYLHEHGSKATSRYSLRRALFRLGPTGFPFEDFLERLFQKEGYQTVTRQTLNGHCAVHEIDIAAYKEEHSFVVEAKFHSKPGIKSDLQVALYSYARLLDLRSVKICEYDHCGVSEMYIVTNTKFTSAAQDYAKCVGGITLLSWEYPVSNNLHDRIFKTGIFPITVLQTLNNSQAQALLKNKVLLCEDLLHKPELLKDINTTSEHIDKILKEASELVMNK